MDNLSTGPTAIVRPLGNTPYHFIAFLNESYIAFSTSPSEDDGVVYGIDNGMRCSLVEWRANNGVCIR
jgi:hypothetical protein